MDDLASRVAGMWGIGRVGSRIAAKIDDARASAARAGLVVQRGDFVWSKTGADLDAAVPGSSPTGMRITAERVAPEEIQTAIVLVLTAAGGMTRDERFSDVPRMLEVGRTLDRGSTMPWRGWYGQAGWGREVSGSRSAADHVARAECAPRTRPEVRDAACRHEWLS